MKHKQLTFTICVALILSVLIVAQVGAHSVTVQDSTRADWFGIGPSANNVGAIVRDTSGRGEFVWTDAKGDQRFPTFVGATRNITRETDLVKFNVTADTANLYFLAKLERYQSSSNDPPVEIMISIDTNHSAGATALPDGVATNVAADAAWEYVVQTQFKAGAAAPPQIYKNSLTPTTCDGCAAQVVSASVQRGSFVEGQAFDG